MAPTPASSSPRSPAERDARASVEPLPRRADADTLIAIFGIAFAACILGPVFTHGFFPLYLPELFPTAVRATAQGFAYNFGRIIAAVGGLQTAVLIGLFNGNFGNAAATIAAIYVVGMVLIWFGPETKGKELPS